MKTGILKKCILLGLMGIFAGCAGGSSGNTAKNIILFIGDGMGSEQRKAARWSSAGMFGQLAMDDMPNSGSIQTRSANSAITDSGAAATAMATGVKTNNGVIGLDAGLSVVATILEDAMEQGKHVGLVTTTWITHATPAAFGSHVEDRRQMIEIAHQLLETGPHVLLGGGEDEFLPDNEIGCFPGSGHRTDGRHLIDEATVAGYRHVCDPDAMDAVDPSSTTKLLGLFADDGLIRPYSPTLAAMTQKAIDILSRNPSGFFLMVEGGQIDWAGHANNAANVISNTISLDKAVEAAKRFASTNPDTLIIVTADHETGGMVVTSEPNGSTDEKGPFSTPDGDEFYVQWSTTDHTAANVPLTSQGPLAYMLSGVNDNTYIHTVMVDAFE